MARGLYILLTSIFLSTFWATFAVAASVAYNPLATWQDPRQAALAQWDSVRTSMFDGPQAEGRRPVILGVSGRNLELLQDALARKASWKTGKSLVVARRLLAQAKERNVQTLRGQMAEAMFLDRHAEYRYVSKPNASQHDVYRPNPTGGRGTHTGQIKYHIDGTPSTYARDMIKDYRSKDFFIPDDHVESLKYFLKSKADGLRSSGRIEEANSYYRNANRVKPIGATAKQIDAATRQAIAEAKLIRVAPYISLGVVSVLALAPTVLAWYEEEMSTDNALYYAGKSGSLVMTGIVADQALRHLKGGILRGTMRGNVLVAALVLAADTSWSIYEYGGVSNAVANPEFLMHFCGGIGSTGCALIGGYVGATIGGTWGAAIGGASSGPLAVLGAPVGGFVGGLVGGIVVGGGCGIAGYVAGQQASRLVMKTFAPDYLFQEETKMAQELITRIDSSIENYKRI